jgi:hypothetical protein
MEKYDSNNGVSEQYVLLLSLLFITFMQTILNYIHETNHVSRVYVLLH